MKFEKAFCEELNQPITPYLARELFFDEENEYYNKKLNFKCPDDRCRAKLIGVRIYNPKRPKKALHFRTKDDHINGCSGVVRKNRGNNNKNIKGEEGFKVTRFPEVFLLERPKLIRKGTVSNEVKIDDELSINESINNSGKEEKKSILKTSSLDHIVDCYLNGDKSIISAQTLSIGDKTKYFKNFFKHIKYFQDEEGLIYWGEIREIKKFGTNYKLIFKDKPWFDGENLQLSIYIKNEIIEKYRKRRLFRTQIEDLLGSDLEILCFFVGVYPQVKSLSKNNTTFNILDVELEHLDHISLTFDKRK